MDPQTLAHAVTFSEGLFTRFLAGFTDATRTRQASDLPNHAIWILGHCALSMARVTAELDGSTLRGDHFRDDPSHSEATWFQLESICRGSIPISDASGYPRLTEGLRIFRDAIARFASTVASQSEGTLAREVEMGGSRLSRGEQVIRLMAHNAYHAGQLGDLRRALGLPRVIG